MTHPSQAKKFLNSILTFSIFTLLFLNNFMQVILVQAISIFCRSFHLKMDRGIVCGEIQEFPSLLFKLVTSETTL